MAAMTGSASEWIVRHPGALIGIVDPRFCDRPLVEAGCVNMVD
jgi:hypothetical protein